jgi:hypothetical protein
MLSKAMFDLDVSNNPVIKLEITSSPDLRDKVAKRFIEAFAHTSQWCEILPTADNQYTIFALKPDELRRQAEFMIARADELEGKTLAYAKQIEPAGNPIS